MIEQDTIKLLRECDAGIKMGIASIEDTIDNVKHEELRKVLVTSRQEHEQLASEIESLLGEYHDEGKDPNPVAKGMSWIKTNAKLMVDDSDKTVADLMTEGANMGVKSLNKYLNQYEAAEEKVKDITKRLIKIEEKLVKEVKEYL
ncbi:MAG: hypothetical protein E7652_05565 [Ruminococcaceae bacterium]|nr:hypothetical protein [Oscillospiraceae bacterium]